MSKFSSPFMAKSPLQNRFRVGSNKHERKLKKQAKTRSQLEDAGYEQIASHRSTLETTFAGRLPSKDPMSSNKLRRKIRKYDKTAKQLNEFY